LRAITLGGASLSGVAGKVGAIAPGLHADLVVLSGDPLDPATRVEMVFVDGRVVLDARAKGDER
ncbi:MAG: amidohydrolase family protein, partial [Phycisphaeraceae bacterium]|nr:amidohydrolase family protein [Phycisphaeraceae bacterium]